MNSLIFLKSTNTILKISYKILILKKKELRKSF